MPEHDAEITHDPSHEIPSETPNESGSAESGSNESADGEQPKKKRRRRRRRRSGSGEGEATAGSSTETTSEGSAEGSGEASSGDSSASDEDGEGQPKKKRRRRRKSSGDREVESKPQPVRAGRDFHDPDEDADYEPTYERKAYKPREWNPEVFRTEQTFADLGLNELILKGLDDAGFVHPTKIQSDLIPIAMTGKDVLGQAKTGTGKTAAFGLPLLHMCSVDKPFQVLILAPTRELAIQIQKDIDLLGKHTGIKTVAIYGGQPIRTQAAKLEKNPHIIVGTPGRVMDMHERRLLPFQHIHFAVLDEVDRMLDIGFREDIRKILSMCPNRQQTIFVSATIAGEIEELARKHMNNPEKLVSSAGSLTADMVTQRYLAVDPWDKRRLLAHLLEHEEPELTLVFCRMKRTVDDVVRYLERKNITAHAIHGDMSQGKRNKTMDQLRKGNLTVLVASDLASRGIDVDGISHVVNYDLPEDPDLYVHRIGRTARAGREGIAWAFVTPEQGPLLTEIETLVNAEIPKMDYPDFERRGKPDNWKDEPKPHIYVVEGVPDKEAKNRYAGPEVPASETMDKKDMAAKFPGGVVPSKLPPKLMRGKVRGRGR